MLYSIVNRNSSVVSAVAPRLKRWHMAKHVYEKAIWSCLQMSNAALRAGAWPPPYPRLPFFMHWQEKSYYVEYVEKCDLLEVFTGAAFEVLLCSVETWQSGPSTSPVESRVGLPQKNRQRAPFMT